jgi:hypothetical protein
MQELSHMSTPVQVLYLFPTEVVSLFPLLVTAMVTTGVRAERTDTDLAIGEGPDIGQNLDMARGMARGIGHPDTGPVVATMNLLVIPIGLQVMTLIISLTDITNVELGIRLRLSLFLSSVVAEKMICAP